MNISFINFIMILIFDVALVKMKDIFTVHYVAWFSKH